jgi:hypothetical protein
MSNKSGGNIWLKSLLTKRGREEGDWSRTTLYDPTNIEETLRTNIKDKGRDVVCFINEIPQRPASAPSSSWRLRST